MNKTPKQNTYTRKALKKMKLHKASLHLHMFFGILKRSFWQLINFGLLMFLSSFMLFSVLLVAISLKQYETNYSNNYGYKAQAVFKAPPINVASFTYNSAKGNTIGLLGTHGYLANAPQTININNISDVHDHQFLYNSLKELEQISKTDPLYKIKATEVIMKAVLELSWYGGFFADKSWFNLLQNTLNENNPACLNLDSSKAPGSCYLPDSALQYLIKTVSQSVNVNLCYYSPTNNPANIDYSKFPVDCTFINPGNLIKVHGYGNIYVSSNLNYFTKGSSEYLQPIKGFADLVIHASYNSMPASVESAFKNPNSNIFMAYNLVPFDPKTDTKITKLNGLDSSALYGINVSGNHNHYFFNDFANSNQNLLKKLNLPPDSGAVPVIINKKYSFLHHLNLGDTINYKVNLPAAMSRSTTSKSWAINQNMSGYYLEPYNPDADGPSLTYSASGEGTSFGINVAKAVANKTFQVANLQKTISLKVIGIDNNTNNPALFVNRQTLNKKMWNDWLGLAKVYPTQTTSDQINYQNYYNGIMSMQDPGPLLSNLIYSQKYGVFNFNGLFGNRSLNEQGYNALLVNTFFSQKALKKELSLVNLFVNILMSLVAILLIVFAVLFLLISVRMLFYDNRKSILLHKALGYKTFEISNRYILVYISVILFVLMILSIFAYYMYGATLTFLRNNYQILYYKSFPWWSIFVVLVFVLITFMIIYWRSFAHINRLNVLMLLKREN